MEITEFLKKGTKWKHYETLRDILKGIIREKFKVLNTLINKKWRNEKK